MWSRGEIEEVAHRAIDRVNDVLLDENALAKRDTTILMGEGSKLDSMGFVNFMVALEEEFAEVTGIDFNLVEELSAASIKSQRLSVAQVIDILVAIGEKK